jgi:tetratricopeptide (TPR) repeat protein
VYAISKNEEQFVERWMDAVEEADLVVVADTGSTDRTVEKLRRRGAIVYEAKISPWRFDVARNTALGHVPADVDICVSNDLDEVFEPGWRQKLEAAWTPAYTRARYLFVWSHNPDGTPNKQYHMEKIHRRHGFRWVRPVHEILEYSGADEDKTVWINGLLLHHYPDPSKPRSQYLSLLELSVKENPQDDRAVFWLGREYMYYGKYNQCIETLRRYLSLPSAKWNEERSAAMRFIAHCYGQKGNVKEETAWLFRAIAECPEVREPYLSLAKTGYRQQAWPLVYAMVEKALSLTWRSESYLVEPESWGAAPYDYGALSAYYLGLYQKARNFAAKACEINPSDERLKANLILFEQKLKELQGKGISHGA